MVPEMFAAGWTLVLAAGVTAAAWAVAAGLLAALRHPVVRRLAGVPYLVNLIGLSVHSTVK